jgi:hypothetical protein
MPGAAGSAASAASTAAPQAVAGRATFSDLPVPAVKHILQLARQQIIRGTNRYARVCHQWREASSSDEDAEMCQLYMNVSWMSEPNLNRASAWLSMHGQQVDVLVLQDRDMYPEKVAWFPAAAPALTRLTWLDVDAEDSLELLAPVLGQLPQLQRLAAHVTLWSSDSVDGGVAGCFMNHKGECWVEVPDLEQLCPHLINFHLTVDPQSVGNHYLTVEQRLSRLLPARLQQLTLVGSYGTAVSAPSLAHLSAVQQLTLHEITVNGQGAGLLAQSLKGLQQVRVGNPSGAQAIDNMTLRLAPKVTEYEVFVCQGVGFGVLFQLPGLTRLALNFAMRAPPEGIADAVAQLTGLQELSVCGFADDGVGSVVQQAAGMSKLRRLQLDLYEWRSAAVASSLGQCTQLTSLRLVLWGSAAVSQPPKYVSALQQLTGLRCLTVDAPLLLAQAGAWLAPLSNLTRLVAKVMRPADLGAVCPGFDDGWSHPATRLVPVLFDKVRTWPAGLHTIVLLGGARMSGYEASSLVEHPAGGSGAGITVWLAVDWGDRSAQGPARSFRPAPHLRHVWELQGPFDSTFAP